MVPTCRRGRGRQEWLAEARPAEEEVTRGREGGWEPRVSYSPNAERLLTQTAKAGYEANEVEA